MVVMIDVYVEINEIFKKINCYKYDNNLENDYELFVRDEKTLSESSNGLIENCKFYNIPLRNLNWLDINCNYNRQQNFYYLKNEDLFLNLKKEIFQFRKELADCNRNLWNLTNHELSFDDNKIIENYVVLKNRLNELKDSIFEDIALIELKNFFSFCKITTDDMDFISKKEREYILKINLEKELKKIEKKKIKI